MEDLRAATTFRVADLTIHRVIEQERVFNPIRDFLPGLSAAQLDENRHWLAPSALDADDGALLCFQSYVVRTPHHVILIDSCIGNDKARGHAPWHMKRDDTFIRGLKAHGLRVEDIDFVLCTHLHADHVGWNTRLENGRWVPTFPQARYIFSRGEFEYWSGRNASQPVASFGDSVLPVIEAGRAELVADEFGIGDHLRLLPTPGHTPNHVAVLLGRDRDEAVMTGDLIHSPLQARYPELSMMGDVDPMQAAVTRRAFLERFCDRETLCCTAHFPSPSVGNIRRWGDGFRCDPVA